ncbi:hypothetical protein J7E80_19045 [Arthrobacter sp. ISL-28]|nr:hypothetical protein [Arthrobacter sp. ISL-28]
MMPSQASFQTLVDQALGIESLVLDEPVTVLVPVIPDPLQHTVRVGKQHGNGVLGEPPAADGSKYRHEQRRGVDAAVICRLQKQGDDQKQGD